MLAAPISKEPLLLYIVATGQVASIVLTVEREEEGKAYKVQRPVYYISEVLTPSKQRYPHYQKLVYGIYMTTKKVAHYFSDHSVRVVNDAPLLEILHNRDATGRVAKWAIELLPLDIKFEAKKAIKSQAVVDFIAEWIEQQLPTQVHSEHWTMFFDGSKMLNGSGAGVVLVSPQEISSDMYSRSTLIPPITKQNTRPFCMGWAWPFHSASVALWFMATQI